MRRRERTVPGTFGLFFCLIFFLSFTVKEPRKPPSHLPGVRGGETSLAGQRCVVRTTRPLACCNQFCSFVLLSLLLACTYLTFVHCFCFFCVVCVSSVCVFAVGFLPPGGLLSGGGSSGVEEERRRHRQRHHGAHHGLGRQQYTNFRAAVGRMGRGGREEGKDAGQLKTRADVGVCTTRERWQKKSSLSFFD